MDETQRIFHLLIIIIPFASFVCNRSKFLRGSDGGDTMISQNLLIFLYTVGGSEVSIP